MSNKHMRKTPPNELVERFQKEQRKKEENFNSKKQKQNNDNEYINVIVKQFKQKRKQFKVNVKKAGKTNSNTQIDINNKFINHCERIEMEQKEEKRRMELLKAMSKLQEQIEDEER